MKTAKSPQKTAPEKSELVDLEISPELYAELEADAAAQGSSIEAEVIYRLRASLLLDRITALKAELNDLLRDRKTQVPSRDG